MSAVPQVTGRRVVVVGNGMAGARFADELHRRAPETDIVVIGAEDRPAYNRVLLSDVLAGKRQATEIALAGPAVARRLGVRVTAIDTGARTIDLADGSALAYDELVLATGSTAFVPPLHGIAGEDGRLLPGVHVMRTLDDCQAIAALAGRVKRAVVVGGGLLGLEAARGLLQFGLAVDVVHGMDRLMDLQLDRLGGMVLRRAVESLGVGVHLGSNAAKVSGTRSVTGVDLADGRHVAGDLVVLACGVRPEVSLARAAGLAVERGILVDDQLATNVPHVHAIGECAQHRGQVYGLVAPAWDQAAVLADVLTGRPAAYTGTRTVARLKAMGLDVASMGETAPEPTDEEDGLEVLQFTDAVRFVHKKLVVRDGVVTGAVLLGDLSTAGVVTQAFDRGSPLASERLHLLFAGMASGPPAELADEDIVCTCNAVTAGALRRCGATTVPEAALATRATTGCGTCASSVAALLSTTAPAEPDAEEPAVARSA